MTSGKLCDLSWPPAYERAGDLDRAKDLFTEIYGVNVSYRGGERKTQGPRVTYGLNIQQSSLSGTTTLRHIP